jgi:serine/threonine protein kinase
LGPTPAPADGFPRPFGSYLLLSAFAKGGMGEVYLAKTGGIEGIERVCVLKKLRPDFGDNKEYVNRFLDEARLVVQLSHANIAHVFDVGRVGNEYYLAMEYVSGVSLKALMARAFERGQPVPPDVALYVLCEVLLGLDYAHRLEHPVSGQPLHLVHRDISPHNVMVSYEGEVKLIDFGLAES